MPDTLARWVGSGELPNADKVFGLWPAIAYLPTKLRTSRGVGVHALRKTAITNALEDGAKMEQVQRLAGYADIRTTQLYFQPRDSDADEAARQIQIR